MQIKTRNDLMKFIEGDAPSGTILRSVMNFNENFGFFYRLPVNNSGGWVVNVISKFGKQQLVAVCPDGRVLLEYRLWVLFGEVPWQYWDGDKSDNPLFQGDHPEKYKLFKERIKNGTAKTSRSENA